MDIRKINLDAITLEDAEALSKQGYVLVIGDGRIVDIKKKEND